MKIEEPKSLQEIHHIQEQIHEEMKNLPPGERSKRINEKARKYLKEHNLSLKFYSKH